MKRLLKTVLLTAFLSQSIYAIQPLDMQSIRQIGLGGAGVAVPSAENALYQNPALLSEVKSEWIFPKMRLTAGDDLQDLKTNLSDFVDANESEQAKILDKMVGLKISGEVGVNALSYTRPGFGFGIFTNTVVEGKMVNPVDPTLKLNAAADVFPTVGFAKKVSIFSKQVSFGLSGKYIYRQMLYDKETGELGLDLSTAELITLDRDGVLTEKFKNSFALQGMGIDLGILMPFTIGNAPGNLGFSAKNIGATLKGEMELDSGQKVTKEISEKITSAIGVSISPKFPRIGRIMFAGDYVVKPSGSFLNRIHFGVEKKVFNDKLCFQGGVNQGYLVMGTEINVGVFELGYAFNTKELGHSPGQDGVSTHVVEFGMKF